MSRIGTTDFGLEVAKGNISGHFAVNKFGRAPDGVQTAAVSAGGTDIWDRADAGATQPLWIAPTSNRLHAIASSSDLDGKTAAPSSLGARTIEVFGLQTWGTNETSETVTLDGTTSVNTVSSYVIVHRLKVLTHGSSGPNVGTITATAAVDGTVTAQIDPMTGQTEMAIYGVPSTQKAYMTSFDINAHNTGNPSTVIEVDFDMLVNEHPDVDSTGAAFIIKANMGMIMTGSTVFTKAFDPPLEIPGPAIIKFNAISTQLDTEAVAEFDLYLVNN